jgi:hypothetical protein
MIKCAAGLETRKYRVLGKTQRLEVPQSLICGHLKVLRLQFADLRYADPIFSDLNFRNSKNTEHDFFLLETEDEML